MLSFPNLFFTADSKTVKQELLFEVEKLWQLLLCESYEISGNGVYLVGLYFEGLVGESDVQMDNFNII